MTDEPEAGFERFARKEVRGLVALARALTLDARAAEDLSQDALVRIMQNWKLVERANDQRAYARKTLVNVFLEARRRKSWLRASQSVDVADLPHLEDHGRRIAVKLSVLDAVRRLPVKQRTVIVLKYYLQLASNEIAEWMSVEESTVRANLSRALATLRESPELAD